MPTTVIVNLPEAVLGIENPCLLPTCCNSLNTEGVIPLYIHVLQVAIGLLPAFV